MGPAMEAESHSLALAQPLALQHENIHFYNTSNFQEHFHVSRLCPWQHSVGMVSAVKPSFRAHVASGNHTRSHPAVLHSGVAMGKKELVS